MPPEYRKIKATYYTDWSSGEPVKRQWPEGGPVPRRTDWWRVAALVVYALSALFMGWLLITLAIIAFGES